MDSNEDKAMNRKKIRGKGDLLVFQRKTKHKEIFYLIINLDK